MAKSTTVSIDQPNRPKGDLIEVPPIGLIENGESVTLEGLTEKQASWLATAPGVTVKHGGKNIEAGKFTTKPISIEEGLIESYNDPGEVSPDASEGGEN